ncbi:tRNA dihydrouridine synthase DusB [Caproiciproducens galactitolivorans]|uniref:tRNA-dihydrouridine synthase n=1 Tax=Caproiciproducens galactitolivorans TaxID=642589 RepID=A0ABT4BR33_9FIRM|nr:tRNA dihydrouridine synthase DusB [Caproiciproducens galactitolivorans]MCY1713349.1 tRNA dihydrouridine synthase DusB [Caproiciproducens galactitolivorans]
MKIGNLKIDGYAVLAPMAGVADQAFRETCVRFGAAYAVSEMVSSKALQFRDKKTGALMSLSDAERPAGIQLFGSEPDVMAEAAKMAMEYAPDVIDINMGCPAPKVSCSGSGSALMKNPPLCGEIVAAVKNAVPVPVTVKIRKGWDSKTVNALEVAKICEAAGADAITVHGRTREQMYEPKADWDIIRQVKQAVKIPVIGNGDVVSAQTAAQMLEQTGCDAVMVGRAALGNPWIFAQINAYLSDSCRILPPPELHERMLVMMKHIRLMCDYKGEHRAMNEARKHVGWYLKGMKNAASYRRRAGTLETWAQLEELVRDILADNAAGEE